MLKFKKETEFKNTEIGEVPRDWEVGKLGNAIKRIIKGSTPKLKNSKVKELVPYLSVGYLRGVEDPNIYPSDAGYLVNDKEVLIIWDGVANAGEIILSKKGILGSTLSILIFKDDLNKYYFYRLFKLFQNEIKSLRSGTDDRHVDKNAFLSFKIPYPPPDEQSRIATVLSWFDDLIENKKRQNEILEKTAMAIFKSWFVDFEPFKGGEFVYNEELGKEIPKGWEVKAIGEVAEFTKGLSYKGSEKFYEKPNQESFVFITLDNILRKGGFKTEYTWIISDRLKERHFLTEGDLIMANTDMTQNAEVIGSPAIVIFPYDCKRGIGVYSHHITKIYLGNSISKYYLYLFLKDTQSENTTFSTGTNVLGLDISNFKQNKFVLLPPKPILQRFNSLVEPLFEKIINNQKEIMVLRKARDALLPLLVFGKLRVEEI